MTLGPDPVRFEARLDALGRTLAAQASSEPPAAFVGLVRRRRRAIAVRKAGAGVLGAAVLAALVMVAQQHRPPAGVRPEVTSPTFASLRTVEDVDAAPQLTRSFVVSPPVARAGERPDGDIGRELAEFK